MTVAWRFLEIPSRPFVTLDVDVTAAETPAHAHNLVVDALEAVDLKHAVVRIRYTATEEQARAVEHSVLAKIIEEDGGHKLFAIQPTIERENRARVDGLDEDITPLAAVEAWANANEIPVRQFQALADLTTTYLQEIGAQ